MVLSALTGKPFMCAHEWNVTPSQAIAIQKQLRASIILEDDFTSIETVAGVDVGFDRGTGMGRAAVVVLEVSTLAVVDSAVVEMGLDFPYIPGLLSFREMPPILKALGRLRRLPDLFLCDGQGIAHPRRFGIACHLGVLTSIPALGVAKSRLTGEHDTVPDSKGEWTALTDGGEVVGGVLRTRKRVKPVYVSAGHRISLASSIDYVMRCVSRYRLPETTRRAHALSLFHGSASEP